MKYLLTLSLLLSGIVCFSQHANTRFSLQSYSPTSDLTDLNQLDTIFKTKRLIGIGEATHGTHEFTLMRHRIFKYLAEKHNYNTFFIEADYGACQRINRYINGEEDSVLAAFNEIKFWTWHTTEMLDFIEWARIYNQSNSNKISFVGCDMQFIDDDYMELKRFLPDSIIKQFNVELVLNELNNSSNDSVINKRFNGWMDLKSQLLNYPIFANNPSKVTHIKAIEQWFEYKKQKTFNYNYRDSCMAVNMLDYLDKNQEAKGMYFAHNHHVSKTIYSHKKRYSKKATGTFLHEQLDSSYYSIALTSSDLTFNAFSCINDENIFDDYHYVVKSKNYVESFFESYEDSICFVSSRSIKKIDKYSMVLIGSVYKQYCNEYKSSTSIQLQEKMFDGFIYIRKTKETDVIPFKR